jgi:hypothetical protein
MGLQKMRTKLPIAILTILVTIVCCNQAKAGAPTEKSSDESSKISSAKTDANIEQAIPVIALLRSVKTTDTALFLQCWDKTMANKMGLTPESVMPILEKYKRGFENTFGEYSLADFSFTFTGTADAGTVTAKFKDKRIPPLKVVKSDGEWKLGER